MIAVMKILALNSKLYNIFKVSVREDLHTTISPMLHLLSILSYNLHRKAKRTPELSPLVSLMAMMDSVVYMIT
jgi:hypothetical protein